MPNDPISGSGEPSPLPNLPPIGGTEETSQVGHQITGGAVRDEVVRSEEEPPPVITAQSDQPSPPPPDDIKAANGLNVLGKFMQNNSWLKPSFLSSFTEVIYELLKMQKQVHYNEAQTEMLVRGKLYELARSNAELSKLITDNQAFEKFVQAFASVATAVVTTINMVETTKNLGEATRKQDQLIETNKKELEKAKREELKGNHGTDAAGTKRVEELIISQKTHEYKSPEVKKAQDILTNNEVRRDQLISEREQTLTRISTMRGEIFKSTVQAASQFATGAITLDRGVLEQIKGQVDAVLQSFNKYSETSAKARDDAKQTYDRFADFLTKIIESVYKAHNISGRA